MTRRQRVVWAAVLAGLATDGARHLAHPADWRPVGGPWELDVSQHSGPDWLIRRTPTDVWSVEVDCDSARIVRGTLAPDVERRVVGLVCPRKPAHLPNTAR